MTGETSFWFNAVMAGPLHVWVKFAPTLDPLPSKMAVGLKQVNVRSGPAECQVGPVVRCTERESNEVARFDADVPVGVPWPKRAPKDRKRVAKTDAAAPLSRKSKAKLT